MTDPWQLTARKLLTDNEPVETNELMMRELGHFTNDFEKPIRVFANVDDGFGAKIPLPTMKDRVVVEEEQSIDSGDSSQDNDGQKS